MDKGMTPAELQALTDALLKAERLEMLMILRDMDSIEEAVKALEQRIRA